MMNEYKKQAENFLKNTGATLEFEFYGIDTNPVWDDGIRRAKYRFVLKTKRGQYTGYFWDSQRNTENKVKPTAYDLLTCLTDTDPGTYEEFCYEFGYEPTEKSSEKVYKAVCKEWAGVNWVFTEAQISELAEIQ